MFPAADAVFLYPGLLTLPLHTLSPSSASSLGGQIYTNNIIIIIYIYIICIDIYCQSVGRRWGSIAASEQQLLPPVLESSFLSNPRTRLDHGQVVHISTCTSFGQVFGQCCRGGEATCQPEQDSLKMMPGLPKVEVLHVLQVG